MLLLGLHHGPKLRPQWTARVVFARTIKEGPLHHEYRQVLDRFGLDADHALKYLRGLAQSDLALAPGFTAELRAGKTRVTLTLVRARQIIEEEQGDEGLMAIISTPNIRIGRMNGASTHAWLWHTVLSRRPRGVLWTQACETMMRWCGWVPLSTVNHTPLLPRLHPSNCQRAGCEPVITSQYSSPSAPVKDHPCHGDDFASRTLGRALSKEPAHRLAALLLSPLSEAVRRTVEDDALAATHVTTSRGFFAILDQHIRTLSAARTRDALLWATTTPLRTRLLSHLARVNPSSDMASDFLEWYRLLNQDNASQGLIDAAGDFCQQFIGTVTVSGARAFDPSLPSESMPLDPDARSFRLRVSSTLILLLTRVLKLGVTDTEGKYSLRQDLWWWLLNPQQGDGGFSHVLAWDALSSPSVPKTAEEVQLLLKHSNTPGLWMRLVQSALVTDEERRRLLAYLIEAPHQQTWKEIGASSRLVDNAARARIDVQPTLWAPDMSLYAESREAVSMVRWCEHFGVTATDEMRAALLPFAAPQQLIRLASQSRDPNLRRQFMDRVFEIAKISHIARLFRQPEFTGVAALVLPEMIRGKLLAEDKADRVHAVKLLGASVAARHDDVTLSTLSPPKKTRRRSFTSLW